jgi:DNA-binding NtrC family response regulator
MPNRISLIVDDEPSVRKYIATILQRRQFQAVEAEDGAHGLRIVRELGDGVALVVSDVQMPGVDGLTLARTIKKSHPAVPVVLVSGQAIADDSFEFVQKPFAPSALLEAVERVTGSKVRAA